MLLDPLSALSLAGTVVQFVDFTIKILEKGRQTYKSADGSTAEHEDLNAITNDLIRLNERLKSSMHSDREVKQLSLDEQALEGVASDCSSIAQELLDHLQQLKVQGKKTKLKSLRQALKNVWNKGELEELDDRLARYREELEVHLLVSIKEQVDVSSLRQMERFDALDRSAQLIISYVVDDLKTGTKANMFEQLASLHDESERRLIREHEKTRSEIRAALQERDSGGNARTNYGMAANDDDPIAVNWNSANLRQEREMKEIRDSLWFPMINERHEGISEHHKHTFEWVYRNPTKRTRPWSNFSSFLGGNDSVYWINGKPGSGKSTLMKYLYDNSLTQGLLQQWSKGHQLVTAAFFFWNSGTRAQKTLESLLRSLLLHTMKGKRGCPDLIPIVLREQITNRNYKLLKKDQFHWSLAQLKRAFNRLVTQDEIPVKIFFMIDGLDECDDNHDELVAFLLKLSSPKVKILLSSRPWNVFKDAFGGMPQLRLQDLTSNDIALYVEDNLKKNERMQHLLESNSEQAEALASEIVARSSGVFLWVKVVVGSLIDGLRNHDRISDLQARLLLLPSDLAEVYQHILSRMDAIYQIHRTKYLLMRRAAVDPPLTLAFSLADEEDPDYCLKSDIQLMTRGEAVDRCEELERRLEASCAGLIEIDYRKKIELPDYERHRPLTNNDYYRTAFGSRVQYLHRTVRDFFESPKYAAQIENILAGTDFDPNNALLRAWILRLKVLPLEHFDQVERTIASDPHQWGLRSLKEVVKEAKQFALLAEQKSGTTLTVFRDELDRTMARYESHGSRIQYQYYVQHEGPQAPVRIHDGQHQLAKGTKEDDAKEKTSQSKSDYSSPSIELSTQRPRSIFRMLFCFQKPRSNNLSQKRSLDLSHSQANTISPSLKIEWTPPSQEQLHFKFMQDSLVTPALEHAPLPHKNELRYSGNLSH